MSAYVLTPTSSAAAEGPRYKLSHRHGSVAWPIQNGGGLGGAGVWNFLWRLGLHPRECTLADLPEPTGAILWCGAAADVAPERLGELRAWMRAGGFLVASGSIHAWASLFDWPQDGCMWQPPENPYAGLGYVAADSGVQLLAPPRWSFASLTRLPADILRRGTLVAVQGERQTPGRATVVAVPDAPAMAEGNGFCYLNGNPFAAFQAWLQGQETLGPWLGWRHRLFWLDEWVSSLAGLLETVPRLSGALQGPGIAGLGSSTVVLRHDVDYSRDLGYLEETAAAGMPATYAVLRDRHTAFWRETLSRHPEVESALHYTTGRVDWWLTARAWRYGRRERVYVPSRRALSRRGLRRQTGWARAHGIGTATLHRHLGFLLYPEWVDAMDHLFASETAVRGSSSMFRAQILRWGAERVDGMHGTITESPDCPAPMWLPYKLAHAGRGGERLRGWESASLVESEPELVEQLLRYRVPRLPQRVLTLGYHPAHARGSTFARGGFLPQFRRVVAAIRERGADVRTLRDVYERADGTVQTAPPADGAAMSA